MAGMKSISASIIVLAGALTFAIGGTIQHSDTQSVVCIVGIALGILGLGAWAAAFLSKAD
jgi:hypothetical protein